MSHLFLIAFFWLAHASQAQIAPECIGVAKPADYDEDKQRSFMQNHSMVMFMPLPVIDSHPSDPYRTAIGIDTTLVPKLSCAQRLAINGTKTEDADKMPLLPRPHASVPIFKLNRFAFMGGASFLPPVMPKLLLWHAAIEGSVLYEPITGIALGARTFIGLSYLRTEIATPFVIGAETKEDWFSFAIIGGDLSSSFAISFTENQKLYPFLSFGLVKGASIFVVADDGVPVTNKFPLIALTNFVGLSYHLFDRLSLAVVVGGALNVAMTGHLRLAFLF